MAVIPRIDVVATLSLATDLAIGQPLEFALRSCALSVWFAESLAWSTQEISEVYYQALLRYIGCNADTYALSALFGDETAFRREFALVDQGRAEEVARVVFRALRRASAGRPFYAQALAVARGMAVGKAVSEPILGAHCEVAKRLAERLGFEPGVVRNLGQLYERWDGKGLPAGLKGEAIAPAVRLVTLTQDAIVLEDAHGRESMLGILRRRRGDAYEPALVDAFLPIGPKLLDRCAGVAVWDHVVALEPAPRAMLSEEAFDEACLAIGDFVDIRSPTLAGHSRAVAALAKGSAIIAGLPDADVRLLWRAGLLHDLGEVATPVATWIKATPLSDGEREALRLHPHHGERLLARARPLAALATLVGQHHERADGSGYHRGLRANALSAPARLLAAGEAYQTRLEERPHRPALSAEAATAEIRRMARGGALDGDAAAAVLEAAGRRIPPMRRDSGAGLTRRENEVLRAIARGLSTKAIARELGLTPKTAANHTQNVFQKIGVGSRAAAMLYAMEHGLLALDS